VATALAVLLERSGHRVVAAAGRAGSRERVARHLPSAEFFDMENAAQASPQAEIVMIGASDDAIPEVSSHLAGGNGFRPGHHVVHLSGSVGLDALDHAVAAGAEALCTHPLQAFPTVEAGVDRFPGSSVAITARTEEALSIGETLATDAGGVPFSLAEDMKPLYHAAAVFCANYLVTVEAVAEELFRIAGLAEPVPRFAPLATAVLDRTLAEGPASALTGPAVRGDVGTVRRNLEALAVHSPGALAAYVELARMALRLAASARNIAEPDRERIEQELSRWK
jgi:predicted short-subunit dehydrogenase-like oxidoreductase (DUF2520 family)